MSINKAKVNKTMEVMNPPADSVDIYSAEFITEIKKHSASIRNELKKVEGAFNKIAFNLYWIYKNEGFKPLGYKNVYDFAKVEFGIAKGTCNGFINVVEKFGKRIDGKVTEEIDDNFKDFKSSQLLLMTNLSDVDLQSLSADMSVRDMKKKIKELTGKEIEATEKEAEQAEATPEPVDVEAVEVNRQILIKISDMDSWNQQEDKIYEMVRRIFKAKPNCTVEVSYTWTSEN